VLVEEQKTICERAVALRSRLQHRTSQLIQRHSAHMAAKPSHPGLLALAAGVRAKHVQDSYSWATREQALDQRLRQIAILDARLSEYTSEVAGLLHQRAALLAVRNISRRNPDLANAVHEQRMARLRHDRDARSVRSRSR
jgi:hypothetical protein